MKHILLYLFVVITLAGYSQSLLTFHFSSIGNNLNIVAVNDNNESNSIVLRESKKRLINDFDAIYNIINDLKKSKRKKLDFITDSLSQVLIPPFEPLISKCERIQFVIDPELLGCSFDLLKYNGVPLFLQFEIVYCLENIEFDKVMLNISNGLIISDPTADPEDGCISVHKLFLETEYFKIENASVELIAKHKDIDLLLISAHGGVNMELNGKIDINETPLNADVLSKINPKLVYIDACQQGINLSYINALKENRKTHFFIAPIISNDAGDSSTKTIQWFFTRLNSSKDPINALSYARKKLYSFYSYNTSYNKIKILNKSFPFRIYQIL